MVFLLNYSHDEPTMLVGSDAKRCVSDKVATTSRSRCVCYLTLRYGRISKKQYELNIA